MQVTEWLYNILNVSAVTDYGKVRVGKTEGVFTGRINIFEKESIPLISKDAYHGKTAIEHVTFHSAKKDECLTLSSIITPLIQPDLTNGISSAIVTNDTIQNGVEGSELYTMIIEILIKAKS